MPLTDRNAISATLFSSGKHQTIVNWGLRLLNQVKNLYFHIEACDCYTKQ